MIIRETAFHESLLGAFVESPLKARGPAEEPVPSFIVAVSPSDENCNHEELSYVFPTGVWNGGWKICEFYGASRCWPFSGCLVTDGSGIYLGSNAGWWHSGVYACGLDPNTVGWYKDYYSTSLSGVSGLAIKPWTSSRVFVSGELGDPGGPYGLVRLSSGGYFSGAFSPSVSPAGWDVDLDDEDGVYYIGLSPLESTPYSLWKLDINLAVQWRWGYGIIHYSVHDRVIVNASKESFLLGPANPSDSTIIQKVNADGSTGWDFSPPYDEGNRAVDGCFDSLGNLYVVGALFGTDDIWQILSDGTLGWHRRLVSLAGATAIDIDSEDNLYVGWGSATGWTTPGPTGVRKLSSVDGSQIWHSTGQGIYDHSYDVLVHNIP